VDIYITVVNFSDRRAVKRRLDWLKNYFRQEVLSRALDAEFVWDWSAPLLGFVFFPYSEVAIPEDLFCQ